MITSQIAEQFIRANPPQAWISALNHWMPRYSIDTPQTAAAFIAQCAHESAHFCTTSENLNYSAEALQRVFGRYFKDRDARAYARRPESIANVVYANRMGNGNERSGDGWRYRGRGIIQLTGYNNYAAFAEHINQPLDRIYDKIDQPDLAVRSACWFWSTNNLNKIADDVTALTRAINGGTNGLEHRRTLHEQALTAFGVAPQHGNTARPSTNKRTKPTAEQIKAVQEIIGVTPDGIAGPRTAAALKRWQKLNKLTVDGIIGAQVLEFINS